MISSSQASRILIVGATLVVVAAACGSDEPASTSAPVPQCDPAPENLGMLRIGSDLVEGERFDLEVRIEREGADIPESGTGVTPVTVEVEALDESGALLRWRSDTTALTGFVMPEDELADAGLSLSDLPQQEILYRIDTDGYFAGVENVEQVRATALDALDVLAEVIPDDGSAEALENLYRTMDAEQIALTFAEEVFLFHNLDGGVIEPGDSFEYDDLLPNSLGGEPFPATTSFSMAKATGSGGCAEVALVTVPKGDDFARIMWETVEGTLGAPADAADLVDRFDIRNEVVASIDATSGRVQQITATQEITALGRTRIDTTTITRVDAE